MKRGERRRKVRNIHYSFSLSLFDFFEKKVKRLCQRQNDIFLQFCVKSGLLGKNLPLKTKKTAFDTCQRQVSFLVSFFWLKLALTTAHMDNMMTSYSTASAIYKQRLTKQCGLLTFARGWARLLLQRRRDLVGTHHAGIGTSSAAKA